MRLTTALAGAAVAAAVAHRLRTLAAGQGRGLAEVLPELPRRLLDDVATLPSDLRAAVADGRDAARRGEADLDRRYHEAAEGERAEE